MGTTNQDSPAESESRGSTEPPATGPTEVAAWAGQRKKGWRRLFDVILAPSRVLVFISAPALAAFGAVWLQRPELVVFPVFILLATGFFASLGKLVERYSVLGNIPGIDFALQQNEKLRANYLRKEPTIFGTGIGLITRARSEYRPYWTIVGLLAIVLAIDTAVSYRGTYPPYLGPADALVTFGLMVLGMLYVVMFVLVPLSAVSFRYSLSGKRWRLRILSLIALVVMGLALWIGLELEEKDGTPSLLGMQRIQLRMNNPDFRDALAEKMLMFLLYYTVTQEDAPQSVETLTNKFQELVAGIAPGDEGEAFAVGGFDDPHGAGKWLGIRYTGSVSPVQLMILSSEFDVFDSWEQLPPHLANQLVDGEPVGFCTGLIVEYDACQGNSVAPDPEASASATSTSEPDVLADATAEDEVDLPQIAPPTMEPEAPAPVAVSEAPAPVAVSEAPAAVTVSEAPAPVAVSETPAPAVVPETPAPAAVPEAPARFGPTGPIRVGGDIKPPVKISGRAPRYTEVALRSRLEGVVIIEAIIDEQGNVTDVEVVEPGLPLGLNQAAIDAVSQWKFVPTTLNGKPVAVSYRLTIDFKL